MRGTSLSAVLACAWGVALGSGCTGNIGGEHQSAPGQSGANAAGTGSSAGGMSTTGGGGTVAPLGGPGRVVMHRLNIAEYDNTVHDLLGTDLRLSENFPPDDTAYGFDNVASALSMTDVTLGYYIDAAKKLAAEALSPAKRSAFISCDVASGKETCVNTALSAFLPRAWRRPGTADEVARLVALYTSNKADGATDDEALGRVLQAALLAPAFLFRIEHNSGKAEVRALDGYELASRLSYFLWSSMPDAALTQAAASGALADTAGLATQITRLLADERAARLAKSFGSQWLTLRSLDNVHPDALVYAGFDDALRTAMRDETMRFFTDIAAGQRPLRDLLTTTSGYVNDRLAKHYGMAAVGSSSPVFLPLPPERGGLLTQASILIVLAHPKESAPVLRGKWILNQVEKQLDSAAVPLECQSAAPPNNSTDYVTRLGAMMDVMEFAYRCDLTRVVTFGFGNAFGPGPMPWIGIGDDYHALTHRMTEPGVSDQVAKCILWEVEQIAVFLKRLKAMPEGDHNVLYNTAMFVSSDVGEGGPHNHDNMACLIAGNAGGAIASGRHLAYKPEDNNARKLAQRRNAADRAAGLAIPNSNRMANVHLSLLQAAGVPATSFADSTKPIPGLLAT